ncbi:MAG TPA: hypothetical protein VH253_02030 [Phycisphaerae bacterium]|nr:hypothetical protein [Phycisphaerae bacterium]
MKRLLMSPLLLLIALACLAQIPSIVMYRQLDVWPWAQEGRTYFATFALAAAASCAAACCASILLAAPAFRRRFSLPRFILLAACLALLAYSSLKEALAAGRAAWVLGEITRHHFLPYAAYFPDAIHNFPFYAACKNLALIPTLLLADAPLTAWFSASASPAAARLSRPIEYLAIVLACLNLFLGPPLTDRGRFALPSPDNSQILPFVTIALYILLAALTLLAATRRSPAPAPPSPTRDPSPRTPAAILSYRTPPPPRPSHPLLYSALALLMSLLTLFAILAHEHRLDVDITLSYDPPANIAISFASRPGPANADTLLLHTGPTPASAPFSYAPLSFSSTPNNRLLSIPSSALPFATALLILLLLSRISSSDAASSALPSVHYPSPNLAALHSPTNPPPPSIVKPP